MERKHIHPPPTEPTTLRLVDGSASDGSLSRLNTSCHHLFSSDKPLLPHTWPPLVETVFNWRQQPLNERNLKCVYVFQGRNGLAGSHSGRSYPRRSFVRPSWMDEDMVDSHAHSADTSESLFFSKVSPSPFQSLSPLIPSPSHLSVSHPLIVIMGFIHGCIQRLFTI